MPCSDDYLQSGDAAAIIPEYMKLRVDNFALIKHAEIDIDGITVIAGNNNSGKSTVGKILFTVFTALQNINEKIENQYHRKTVDIITTMIAMLFGETEGYVLGEIEGEVRYYVSATPNGAVVDWENLFKCYEQALPVIAHPEEQNKIKSAVAQIDKLPRLRLMRDAVRPFFSSCFHQQINSLISPELPANVSLRIKNSNTKVTFEDHVATEIVHDIELNNKAIFYSSPQVVDLMDARMIDNVPIRYIISLLRQYDERLTDDSDLLEKSMLQERLKDVLKKIGDVLPGRILKLRRGYGLYRPEWKEPLSLKNLSMGLKAFVVLKMLLESNQLKDKDVLILDEPEIHLHPTWQLVYAELIVLLQKEFDLSVVITTHSNFFLNAIETYSRKYATVDKLKLYLADVQADGAVMKDVTNNPELIYQKMAVAVDVLTSERLSYE